MGSTETYGSWTVRDDLQANTAQNYSQLSPNVAFRSMVYGVTGPITILFRACIGVALFSTPLKSAYSGYMYSCVRSLSRLDLLNNSTCRNRSKATVEKGHGFVMST